VGSDWRGLEVSGADPATVEALDRFQHDFLGFRDEAGAVFDLAEHQPGCLVAQLYAAGLAAYTQVTAEIDRLAGPHLARAQPLVAGATEREQALAAAVDAWCRSDLATAADEFEALVRRWPQDAVGVKFAEFVFFERPDYPRHLALMETAAPANRDLAPFLAMLAFAHDLNGQYGLAEEVAGRALAMDPDTPWADHALGHVYLNTARTGEGRAALAGAAPRWDGHGVGIRAHNGWHLALLQLADLEIEAAMASYRRWFDGSDPGSAFEHTDAISFLWRLELCGLEVDRSEWEPFVPWAAERADDHVMAFMNAHYVYALGRAGQGAVARAALDRLARTRGPRPGRWAVGLPLLRGVLALAEDDPSGCVAALEPVRPDLPGVGGSDAQNDLFQQSYLVALARSGRTDAAAALLAQRLGGRRATPQEERWLARAG
jgi:tetratricopeptide (TPR) repeat protein